MRLLTDLYSGKLSLLEGVGGSLVEAVCRELKGTFAEEWRRADPPDFLERLGRARTRVSSSEAVHQACRQLVSRFLPVEELVWEPPRLRVVLPGAHTIPAAAPVYYAHRDTWYANPASQINWWVPLHKVQPEEGLLFYADAFERAIENDSHRFDYRSWRSQVGFSNLAPPSKAVYPRALEDLSSWPSRPLSAEVGSVALFSAAHLHQTQPLRGSRARLSVDFRTVYLPHQRAGLGAPDPDNFSQGSTLPDYGPL